MIKWKEFPGWKANCELTLHFVFEMPHTYWETTQVHCTGRQDMRAEDTLWLNVSCMCINVTAVPLPWNFYNIYFFEYNPYLSLSLFSPPLLFHSWSMGKDFMGFWRTALLSPLRFCWKVEPEGLCTPLHSMRGLGMEDVGTMISIWHTASAPLNVSVQPGSGKLPSLFRSKDASNWNFSVLFILDFGKEFANSTMFWLHCLVWGLKLSWKCIC